MTPPDARTVVGPSIDGPAVNAGAKDTAPNTGVFNAVTHTSSGQADELVGNGAAAGTVSGNLRCS